VGGVLVVVPPDQSHLLTPTSHGLEMVLSGSIIREELCERGIGNITGKVTLSTVGEGMSSSGEVLRSDTSLQWLLTYSRILVTKGNQSISDH